MVNAATAEPDDATLVAALAQASNEDRDRLRAAVAAVEGAPGPLARWEGGQRTTSGALQWPYPVYDPAVNELLKALERVHAVPVFDWMAWDKAAAYASADTIAAAPLADVLRVLTTLVRGERFCDGTLARALDDGRLLSAARRVAAGQ